MKKILLAALLSFSASAFSQTPEELLQVKLNDIRSMTANFKQVVKAKERVVSRSSGTMA
jgi:outer membrane lipoprotein carrier protein